MSQRERSPLRTPGILELIASHATNRPDRVAITHIKPGRAPHQVTWPQLLRSAEVACDAMRRTIPDNAIVPSYISKSVDAVVTLVAAVASGHVYAGISPKFRLRQLIHVLDACAADHAFVDSSCLGPVRDGVHTTDRMRETTWHLLDPQHVTGPSARAAVEAIRTHGQLRDFAIPASATDRPEGVPNTASNPQRPAICLFTSGSTGAPKGVLVSWSDLLQRAQAECDLFGISAEDRLLSLLPFSFDVGLNQLMSALVSGAELVIQDSWMPSDILKTIAEARITGISGVPSIWLSLLKGQRAIDNQNDHASLRYLTISGGDMETEQLRRFAALVPGVSVFKTYGQTESFRSTALRGEELLERPRSVGRPFGTAKVYIVRADGSQALPDEQGEVVHTGLGVMLGYLNEHGTQGKRRPNPFFGDHDDSAYAIFTGDHGHLDDQGYLYLAGRQDDMVKVAGHRLHLSELAAEMARIPGVLTAEALALSVGQTDPVLAVFVQPDLHGGATTAEELRAEARRRLPTYMWPSLILLKSSFPLTATGKPDRKAMQAEALDALNAT